MRIEYTAVTYGLLHFQLRQSFMRTRHAFKKKRNEVKINKSVWKLLVLHLLGNRWSGGHCSIKNEKINQSGLL